MLVLGARLRQLQPAVIWPAAKPPKAPWRFPSAASPSASASASASASLLARESLQKGGERMTVAVGVNDVLVPMCKYDIYASGDCFGFLHGGRNGTIDYRGREG